MSATRRRGAWSRKFDGVSFAARFAGFVLTAALVAFGAGAARADELRGVVLDVLSARGEAVIRHDAMGGMPAMTMVFRVEPAGALRTLHVGDRIAAHADLRADPERIDRVRVLGHSGEPAPGSLHDVTPLVVGDVLPPTQFFDQSGRAFGFSDFRGQTVVLSFIYTRCRDPRMCPLISSSFAVLQRKLAGLPVHLVEITLDPAFDTPPVLASYGQRFGADPARWSLGTGTVDVVTDFAARFGIAVFADPTAGLIHTERTAILDREGRITDLFDAAAWNPNDVAARVRELSALPSNPVARLDFELSKWSAAICGNNLPGYSGLLDLAIVLGIFGAASWALYRIGRKIFIENV
jgi:protein SCO1/2